MTELQDLLLSPIEAKEYLAQDNKDRRWVAIDGTSAMVGLAHEHYLRACLPDARYFDIDQISNPTTELPHMLPNASDFADAMTHLGIEADDGIIIYEQSGLFAAARVWWTFLAMKHPGPVRILDGGFPTWLEAGFPVQTGEPVPPRRSRPYVTAGSKNPDEFKPVRVISWQEVHAAAASSGVILDARSYERYAGASPEPRPGLRSGHIPGSISLPYPSLMDYQGQMLPPDRLREILSPVIRAHETGSGRSADGKRLPIITSCGSGITACVIALGLERVGHRDWAVYDGAWAEWGKRVDLPIGTGAGRALELEGRA